MNKGYRGDVVAAYPGVEVQAPETAKAVKIASCTTCPEKLIVSLFAAEKGLKCATCKSSLESRAEVGSQVIVQAGKTDPAKAANLEETLINPHFAHAICPVHPDDPEHVMELKSVNHSEHYGPSQLTGYDRGRPQYRQIAKGETVMHQCLHCKATVSYSTTAQSQFRRVNEPTPGEKHVNGWARQLGIREETT